MNGKRKLHPNGWAIFGFILAFCGLVGMVLGAYIAGGVTNSVVVVSLFVFLVGAVIYTVGRR